LGTLKYFTSGRLSMARYRIILPPRGLYFFVIKDILVELLNSSVLKKLIANGLKKKTKPLHVSENHPIVKTPSEVWKRYDSSIG
jgi:hypothetical protein